VVNGKEIAKDFDRGDLSISTDTLSWGKKMVPVTCTALREHNDSPNKGL